MIPHTLMASLVEPLWCQYVPQKTLDNPHRIPNQPSRIKRRGSLHGDLRDDLRGKIRISFREVACNDSKRGAMLQKRVLKGSRLLQRFGFGFQGPISQKVLGTVMGDTFPNHNNNS